VEERRKNKQPRRPRRLAPLLIIGGLATLLLLTLIILQSSNIWKNLSVQTANDTLLFYGLSSLNFIAFIIFAFIFIRSLLKLSRERKALQLGAKIKTRLLVYFIAVSLLPIVAMAGFSYLYLNRALERWFSQFPEEVMREARQIQMNALENQNRELDETVRMLAFSLDSRKSEITNDDLKQLNDKGDLARIEITSAAGENLGKAEDELPDDVRKELDGAIRDFKAGTYDRDGGKFQISGADMSGGRKLIVVPSIKEETNYSQKVAGSLAEFDELKQQQQSVRQIAISTLGLLTFLLLFASSWAAFYVARGIAQPIKALAEGADEITRGNLTHRVEVPAEDELALLVEAFNQMANQLEENRANLELSAAELQSRQKYIETVLQSLSTGVISFDSENRVNTINDAARNMLRLGDRPCIKSSLEELVTADNLPMLERLLGRAQRIGQAGEQTVLSLENGAGHESLPVALMAAALRGEGMNEHSGVVLVLEDLSELLSAQRAAAWAEVARRMAHEIKNPLTPIQLSAERIAKRFAAQNGQNGQNSDMQTAEVVKDGTETILREVHSLKAMVDEFSRFARLPKVKLESGNINHVLRQTMDLYQDRLDSAAVELYLMESLPDSTIDSEQLKRVFVNLVENAIEAFDAAQSDKIITVKSFYHSEKDLITVEFADNGGGVPPQDFIRIFQPYFSTKGRGTGLGLAIVQRIIIDHGGKIRAAANLPKGAKFIIELPVNV
jgi:two-component system nitrogen regulation sensor histidine kinase NtrY